MLRLVFVGGMGVSVLIGCGREGGRMDMAGDEFAQMRQRMVQRQMEGRDIRDAAVLEVMRKVPRHLFVPSPLREYAYNDQPLPIGEGQTISQPYIVAYMTQALELKPNDRVLEIGTGSGYQAAVLAELVAEVYSIEIVPELGERSAALLKELGYDNVRVRVGDGYFGWPEKAPFDAVMVTAAPDHIPPRLVEQLVEGGRMVLPVGDEQQALLRLRKKPGGEVERERLLPVRFVPMTGEAQK